jgi:hypothetical protein
MRGWRSGAELRAIRDASGCVGSNFTGQLGGGRGDKADSLSELLGSLN